jgi:hypothetical protein
VQAIVGTRVSSEVQAMPCVQLIDLVSTVRPFGPGSGGTGLQRWIGVARCWSSDSPTGAIQSRQLAGEVQDAMDQHWAAQVGTRFICRAYAPDIDGLTRDPDTHRPYYDVRVEAIAGAQPVA